MKIIINESQIRLLGEDLNSLGEISYDMKVSIALWCLMNDFRFFNPKRIFGTGTSLANDIDTRKEICQFVMASDSITEANDEKETFGYYDYDDYEEGDDEREEYMRGYKIYKVSTNNVDILIEVSDDIGEKEGKITLQDYEDGAINNELVGWFYNLYW